MKRVWIIDETLSPACFIYYTLAFPAGNSVSYMCGHYLVSESKSFQDCASNILNGIAGNIGEREELRWQRVGQHGINGDKREGKSFLLPPPPFPFSLALYPLCLHPPGQNVARVARKARVPTHIRRHKVACGAG